MRNHMRSAQLINMKMISLIISMQLILSGCGGGDSSGPSETTGGIAGGTTAAPASVKIASQSMDDLNVPDGFNYRMTKSIIVDVAMSSRLDATSYLSVYTRYTTADNGLLHPISGSKVMSAILSNGQGSVSFQTSIAYQTFLVEIWQTSHPSPIQRLIHIEDLPATDATTLYTRLE